MENTDNYSPEAVVDFSYGDRCWAAKNRGRIADFVQVSIPVARFANFLGWI
jgi:hypothetical protein